MEELYRIAAGLLNELAVVEANWAKAKLDMQDDFPDWYIYCHFCNIGEIVSSIIVLRRNEKFGAIKCLMRTAVESYFNLTAAIKDPSFAKNKVYAELDEMKRRVGLWSEIKPDEQAADVDNVMAGVKDITKLFGDNVGEADKDYKWSSSTFKTSELTKTELYYRTAYFNYSMNVHAHFGILINDAPQNMLQANGTVVVSISLLVLVLGSIVDYRKESYVDECRERIAQLFLDLVTLTGQPLP